MGRPKTQVIHNNETTVTEICKELNVNRATVYAWAKRGFLTEFFLYEKGGSQFYKKDALIKFIENRFAMAQAPSGEDSQNGPTLSESKTKKERFLANMAEIEYLEKIKTLVKVKSVKKVFSTVCKITKNSLSAIPGRIAAELAQISDIKEIEERLSQEINQALEELASSDYK
jgi:hypothetical protein